MADDQIEVQITADTSDLEDGLQRAGAAVAATFDGMSAATQQVDVNFDQLGGTVVNNGVLVQAAMQGWEKSLQPITAAIDKTINGMILGTETWRQAVARLGAGLVADEADNVVKMVANWAASELAKTAATEEGVAERSAAEASGSGASLVADALGAIKAITSDAAQAFAGVFAFLAPELGPAAAGPAAAAQASVLAVAGEVVSASGGLWSVPSDMLAMVHAQGTILPPSIAGPMRSFFAGGAGASNGVGDNYSITIQALDTQTGAQFLKNNASIIVQALQLQQRNGGLQPSAFG